MYKESPKPYSNQSHFTILHKSARILCVQVEKTKDQNTLGLAISGGTDYPNAITGDTSIVITDVVKGSPSDGKLKQGDILLSVNGTDLYEVTHQEAARALRDSSPKATMFVIRNNTADGTSTDPQLQQKTSTRGGGITTMSSMEQDTVDLGPNREPSQNYQTNSSQGSRGKAEKRYLARSAPLVRGTSVEPIPSPEPRGQKSVHEVPQPVMEVPPNHASSDPAMEEAELPSNVDLSASSAAASVLTFRNQSVKSTMSNKSSSSEGSTAQQSTALTFSESLLAGSEVPFQLKRELGFGYGVGLGTLLFVKEVTANSSAAAVGLRPGDIVQKINGIPVTNFRTVEDAVNLIRLSSDPLDMVVQRLTVTIPGDKLAGVSANTNVPRDGCLEARSEKAHYKSSSLSQEVTHVDRTYSAEKTSMGDPTQDSRWHQGGRVITFTHTGSVGLRVVGGNAIGIFVLAVMDSGPAASSGISVGDQILSVNDESFINMTLEDAVIFLLKVPSKVVMVVASSAQAFEKAKSSHGEDFFIRTNFNYQPVGARLSESPFKRCEVFHIRDTMHGTSLGWWQGQRVNKQFRHLESTLIPGRSRADQLVLTQTSPSDDSLAVLLPHLASTSSSVSSYESSTGSYCKSQPTSSTVTWKTSGYDRIVLGQVDFSRPVVISGPISELVRDQLAFDFPETFCYPRQGSLSSLVSQSSLESLRFMDIKSSMDQGKHCLLDMSSDAVEFLLMANLCPIVILIKATSLSAVRSFRKDFLRRFFSSLPDPSSRKKVGKFSRSSNLSDEKHNHLIDATFLISENTSAADLYQDLFLTIERLQMEKVWTNVKVLSPDQLQQVRFPRKLTETYIYSDETVDTGDSSSWTNSPDCSVQSGPPAMDPTPSVQPQRSFPEETRPGGQPTKISRKFFVSNADRKTSVERSRVTVHSTDAFKLETSLNTSPISNPSKLTQDSCLVPIVAVPCNLDHLVNASGKSSPSTSRHMPQRDNDNPSFTSAFKQTLEDSPLSPVAKSAEHAAGSMKMFSGKPLPLEPVIQQSVNEPGEFNPALSQAVKVLPVDYDTDILKRTLRRPEPAFRETAELSGSMLEQNPTDSGATVASSRWTSQDGNVSLAPAPSSVVEICAPHSSPRPQVRRQHKPQMVQTAVQLDVKRPTTASFGVI